MGIKSGDMLCVNIYRKNVEKYSGTMPFAKSFGGVPAGRPLIYLNELLNVSIALNRDNFAGKYNIRAGKEWKVKIKKCMK